MPTLLQFTSRAGTLALFATTALAQLPPLPTSMIRRQGPFSSWAVGMVNGAGAADEMLLVQPAPRTAAPAVVVHDPLRQDPNYSVPSMFPYLPQFMTDLFEFSAIDSGNAQFPDDWTVLSSSGVAYGIAPDLNDVGRWLGLTASVTGSSPLPSHPLLSQGDGSDLFSYFFVDSQGVAASLPGALHIEQTAAQMMLPGGADISAFDFQLGMLMANPDDALSNFAPSEDELYFSVTPSWASFYTLVASGTSFPKFAADMGAPNNRVYLPHPGVIYRSVWDSSVTPGSWSVPVVYRDHTDLGITATENVDAIAVDHLTNIVIFSTDKLTTQDQLLLQHPTLLPGDHLPLYDTDGSLVSTKMGLTTEDDIDGLCGKDPEISTFVAGRAAGTPRPERFTSLFGLMPSFNGFETPIGFSIARDNPNGASVVTNRLQITGWGPFEQPVPCDVRISMRIETQVGANRVWGPWVELAPLPRSATEDTWHYPWTFSGPQDPSIRRIQLDAYVTCSDPNQWIDAVTGGVVPATHVDATPFVGATWPLDIKF